MPPPLMIRQIVRQKCLFSFQRVTPTVAPFARCNYHSPPCSLRRRPVHSPHTVPPHRGLATTYSTLTPLEKLRNEIVRARRENPILLPILLVAALGAVSLFSLMAYDEYTRVAPQYSVYPTSVEQRLRLALHHTHISPDPDRASSYFLAAIKEAELAGLDPFGEISMGIRSRYAAMLEEFGRVKASIEVLNGMVQDCEERLSELDRQILLRGNQIQNPDPEQDLQDRNLRKVLLKGIIGVKSKMALLYEGEYLQDSKMAKNTLSDAVGLLIRETRDPKSNQFMDDKGFTMMEIASTLALMANLYSTSGEQENALPVFMLTLEPLQKACNGSRSCKEVEIFCSIAATMREAMKKPGARVNGKPATKESLEAARKAALAWADQAIATAAKIEGKDRDVLCDVSLLSAQVTRGYLLLDGNDKVSAKEIFEKLLPIVRENELTPVIPVVEAGLKRATM